MSNPIILDRGVEYYPDTKELLLIRCPKCGKENYALNVLSGICTWCGYDAHELISKYNENPNGKESSQGVSD